MRNNFRIIVIFLGLSLCALGSSGANLDSTFGGGGIKIHEGNYDTSSQIIQIDHTNYIYDPINTTGATPKIDAFSADWELSQKFLRFFDKYDGFSAVKMISVQKKILMVGFNTPKGASYSEIAILRMHIDGTNDNTFGDNGFVRLRFPNGPFTNFYGTNGINAFAQNDGKLVFVYGILNPSTQAGGSAHFRLNSDGVLDKSFGSDGVLYTNSPKRYSIFNRDLVRPLADGSYLSIISLGWNSNALTEPDFLIQKINRNGHLDRSFATKGELLVNYVGHGCVVQDLLTLASGKLLLACKIDDYTQKPLVLVRILSIGMLDSTFGDNGIVRTSISLADIDYCPYPGGCVGMGVSPAFSLNDDDSLFVSGVTQTTHWVPQAHKSIFLAKILQDGTLDTMFGVEGIFSINLGNQVKDSDRLLNVIRLKQIKQNMVEIVSSSNRLILVARVTL